MQMSTTITIATVAPLPLPLPLPAPGDVICTGGDDGGDWALLGAVEGAAIASTKLLTPIASLTTGKAPLFLVFARQTSFCRPR